jgi:hypothetical protein
MLFKFNARFRTLVLLLIVFFAIASRVLIGYSAFVNPLAAHAHTVIQSSDYETSPSTVAHDLGTFKLKRKIAFETILNFPAYLIQSSVEFKSSVAENFLLENSNPPLLALSTLLRPPRVA